MACKETNRKILFKLGFMVNPVCIFTPLQRNQTKPCYFVFSNILYCGINTYGEIVNCLENELIRVGDLTILDHDRT